MARLDIKPGDRRHMLVWRSSASRLARTPWVVSETVNGIPAGWMPMAFATWRVAVDEALRRVGL